MIIIDSYNPIWSRTRFDNRYVYYFESTILKDCNFLIGNGCLHYYNSPKFYKL